MESLIVKPNGFLQPKLPSKNKMAQIAGEATTLAQQAAAIITELLVERRTMDLLVDDLLLGKPGMGESIATARLGRLEV